MNQSYVTAIVWLSAACGGSDLPESSTGEGEPVGPPTDATTCPPSDEHAEVPGDTPPAWFTTSDEPDAVREAVDWLACCLPASIQVVQGLGGYDLDVIGVEGDTCRVEAQVWGDGPGSATRWSCALPLPVEPWEGLLDTLSPPRLDEDGNCVQMP